MKKAVALRYDREKENAPRVVASGKGSSAENIIKVAELHNLPIRRDEDLVELLSKVEIDREIPEKLYVAVAEVFRFIYALTNKPK
ncbi:type III secretion system protein [Sulfuricurvum sp. IAE1]|jgi:flagellar biosynthesis protein|uniref:EscU/YscU/HrcU family type III secretion system export apparatus switch protein n=1 Tax=Sulfuricurvum sp. IAE1 TaxID=2546102 RepID=UPI00104AACDA|nr:EscU/YscU/HrcU family type III secretion system export apparatus switch protein [Sulfuricurvum sp. IAE1]MDD3769787.1 EscU/YscU/HrcU family type III secretion system export apparatus switch protein [Sulfuricurvum sp.]MDX9966868.1 EscU/YscU/HrcU family type III secretion system export apparatus switch protein [Sulfuricurvum sp.]TDA64355.1 type III secretion system protein [Sulfuricurvum sp. IAE1]